MGRGRTIREHKKVAQIIDDSLAGIFYRIYIYQEDYPDYWAYRVGSSNLIYDPTFNMWLIESPIRTYKETTLDEILSDSDEAVRNLLIFNIEIISKLTGD